MTQNSISTITFDVDLANVASAGNGNDIPSVTSPAENFVFTVQLSDVDIRSGASDTLSISPVATTVTVGDVTQALAAQASAITFTATADMTFTDTQCPDVQYMCIHVTAGSGAVYTDINTGVSSNTICTDVSAYIQCAPGMILISFNSSGE